MREARALGLAGVNVTHPCKQLVVPELDELSDDAAALNAVNTVVFDGGRLVGHNTDTTGFADAFRRGLPGVATDRVVVLGAGGAGAAVAHAMQTLGAGALTDRRRRRRTRTRSRAAPRRACGARPRALAGRAPTASSTRPRWAWPRIPAPRSRPSCCGATCGSPRSCTCRSRPQLLRDARARGCRTLSGAGMVALQAAGSMELFAGLRPDRERMLAHVDELTADARQAA